MSKRQVKKMNTLELTELNERIMLEYVYKLHKEYDNETYDEKKYNDKFKCKLCGGKYTRRNRKKHEKSEIHKNALDFLLKYNINGLIEFYNEDNYRGL
jgi:hypothetical protein